MDNKNNEGNTKNKEEILKNKHIEHTYDKILSSIRELEKLSLKDYIIIGLLSLLLILNISSQIFGGFGKKDIKKISERVSRLERKILTPEELEGIGSEDLNKSDKKDDKNQQKTVAIEDNTAKIKELKEKIKNDTTGINQDKVKTYYVRPGDALETVVWKCYKTKDRSTVQALGEYNNLNPEKLEIYVDQGLKVPLLQDLYKWYAHHKELKEELKKLSEKEK